MTNPREEDGRCSSLVGPPRCSGEDEDKEAVINTYVCHGFCIAMIIVVGVLVVGIVDIIINR